VRKLQEYSVKEKKYMLKIARESIKNSLEGKETRIPKDCPKKLMEKGACFVTLEKISEGERHLRGCIGSLTAYKPLIEDIIENASKSAFYDPRFDPVAEEELEHIEIEISILTKPVPLKFTDYKNLIKKLNAPSDGVILSKGSRVATFLPIVWEHFKTDAGYYKEGFLTELCLKAGLMPSAWKEGVKIEIYHAILLREDDFK